MFIVYILIDPHCICHFTNGYNISSEFGSTDINEFLNSKSSRILPKSAVAVVVAKVSRTHTCPSPASLTYLFHRDVGGDFARSLCSVSLSLSLSSSPFLYFKAIFQMPDAQLDLMDSIPLKQRESNFMHMTFDKYARSY